MVGEGRVEAEEREDEEREEGEEDEGLRARGGRSVEVEVRRGEARWGRGERESGRERRTGRMRKGKSGSGNDLSVHLRRSRKPLTWRSLAKDWARAEGRSEGRRIEGAMAGRGRFERA